MKVWVRYLVALSSLKEAKMKKLCDVANTPKTLKHRVKIGHRLMAFIPQLITIGSKCSSIILRLRHGRYGYNIGSPLDRQ